MSQKIIRGNVSKDRKIQQGNDFTVAGNTPTGTYNIIFAENSFSDIPTVVVTVNEASYVGEGGFGMLSFNLRLLEQDQFQGRILGPDNKAFDASFSFIAIGPSYDSTEVTS